MTTEPIFQIGKSALTPELTTAVGEALEKRELVKISVLQNCLDDPKDMAARLADRTQSEVVQVIGGRGLCPLSAGCLLVHACSCAAAQAGTETRKLCAALSYG